MDAMTSQKTRKSRSPLSRDFRTADLRNDPIDLSIIMAYGLEIRETKNLERAVHAGKILLDLATQHMDPNVRKAAGDNLMMSIKERFGLDCDSLMDTDLLEMALNGENPENQKAALSALQFIVRLKA
jgi:hypothetical protein